ncbi:MAG: hypothetical protein ACRBBT_04015 [Paracoccaceae bacterium]
MKHHNLHSYPQADRMSLDPPQSSWATLPPYPSTMEMPQAYERRLGRGPK